MNASTKYLLALSESILATTKAVEAKETPKGSVAETGIKDVEVPDNFVNEIISFSERFDESKEVKEQAQKEVKEQSIEDKVLLEQRLESLIERLKSILKEARTVLTEMTSSGSVGGGLTFVAQHKGGRSGRKAVSSKDKEDSYPPKPNKPLKFPKRKTKK